MNIFEIIEPYLEVLNLLIALAIIVLGIKISIELKGELKKAWKYFLMAILFFGLHEVVGSLAEFEIFEIEGLYAFTEFVFIGIFLASVLAFNKLFNKLSKDKKIV